MLQIIELIKAFSFLIISLSLLIAVISFLIALLKKTVNSVNENEIKKTIKKILEILKILIF